MSFIPSSSREASLDTFRSSAPVSVPESGSPRTSSPETWYVDGYHGGHVYGVPAGSWRDMLGAMKRHPDWALVFDLEPESWSEGMLEDPAALAEIRTLFMEHPDRFELVNHAFGHPYHWLIDGEWSFRHFLQGEALFRDLFPEMDWKVWAPQEPMWTTCLPGILREMGYQAAVLKSPGTAFAGLARGQDCLLLDWVGPDGSSICAVPRYACEDTCRTWETEARYLKQSFVDKCRERGIAFPVGTGLQDIGWKAKPALPFKDSDLKDHEFQYSTWSRYLEALSGESPVPQRLHLDDFRVGLPWGDARLDRVAEVTRESEWMLQMLERAEVICGDPREDRMDLREWEQDVLRAQHHDNWICARWREGEENFSARTERDTWSLRRGGAKRIREFHWHWTRSQQPRGSVVTLMNPLGHEDRRLLQVTVPVDDPEQSWILEDEEGRQIPVQIERHRTDVEHSHEWNNHQIEVMADVKVPACGIRSWKVLPGIPQKPKGVKITQTEDGLTVKSPLLGVLELDPEKGGGISKWIPAKEHQTRIPDGEVWGGFRGCIQGELFDSSAHPASMELLESGPCFTRVRARVHQPEFILETVWVFRSSAPWVEMNVTLTPTGDMGLAIGRTGGETDVRNLFAEDPSWFDQTHKFRMTIPLGGSADRCVREGPGDVGPARLLPQGIQRWQDLQSETCFRWVDFGKEDQEGVACFTDRHTAFVHVKGEDPALVMAWAGSPARLQEPLTRRFALLPHRGDWHQAGLWRAARRWEASLHVAAQLQVGDADASSFLELKPADWELTSCRRCPEGVEVRIYNSAPESISGSVRFLRQPESAWICSPQGKKRKNVIDQVHPTSGRLPLELPPHGWITLRVQSLTQR